MFPVLGWLPLNRLYKIHISHVQYTYIHTYIWRSCSRRFRWCFHRCFLSPILPVPSPLCPSSLTTLTLLLPHSFSLFMLPAFCPLFLDVLSHSCLLASWLVWVRWFRHTHLNVPSIHTRERAELAVFVFLCLLPHSGWLLIVPSIYMQIWQFHSFL